MKTNLKQHEVDMGQYDSIETIGDYTLVDGMQENPYVGAYYITYETEHNSIAFTFCTKPSKWHIFWCKILLGWTWKDKIT
tara:strand:+ start:403 stop:642 length:240 start_codon:yes stop_codon:yes gene_type:complete